MCSIILGSESVINDVRSRCPLLRLGDVSLSLRVTLVPHPGKDSKKQACVDTLSHQVTWSSGATPVSVVVPVFCHLHTTRIAGSFCVCDVPPVVVPRMFCWCRSIINFNVSAGTDTFYIVLYALYIHLGKCEQLSQVDVWQKTQWVGISVKRLKPGNWPMKTSCGHIIMIAAMDD